MSEQGPGDRSKKVARQKSPLFEQKQHPLFMCERSNSDAPGWRKNERDKQGNPKSLTSEVVQTDIRPALPHLLSAIFLFI